MNWLVIIFFALFSGGVGLITYFKTRGDKLDSSDGYFLGGRSLTAKVIAGSLLLTNLSAVNFVGMSEQAYTDNLCVIGWEVCSGIILVIVALVLLPRYLKQGITTIPQFVESRFDPSIRNWVTLLFLIGYTANMLPITLYSGAVAMSQIFNIPEMFDITYTQGIWITVWIIGIVGSVYAVCGGLKAVAISDSINGIALIIGGLLVPIFALLFLGEGNISVGFSTFLKATPEKLNSIGSNTDPLPFGTLFSGMIIIALYYWGTDQAIIQRGLGAKNLKEGQKGLIFAGFLKVLTPIIVIIPGVLAYQIFGGNIKNTETVYPLLVNNVLPKPLLGFFAAAMLGAILSTFNSVLNSASTLFAINIYKPKWGKNKSDKELVKVGKTFSIIVAIVSMVVAPLIMNAPKGLFDFFQTMNVFYNIPIFIVIIMGYVTKKVPPIAAKAGVVFFVISYGICQLTIGSDVHYLYITAVLFIVSCLIMYMIGKSKPMENEFVLENKNVVKIEPWENRYIFSALVVFVMIGVYIVLSPIGIAKESGADFITVIALMIDAVLCFGSALIIEKKLVTAQSNSSNSIN